MKQQTPELQPFDEQKFLTAKAAEAEAKEAHKAKVLREGLAPLNGVEVEPVHIDVTDQSDGGSAVNVTSEPVRAGEWQTHDRPTLPMEEPRPVEPSERQ